jgi:hypothetical protein
LTSTYPHVYNAPVASEGVEIGSGDCIKSNINSMPAMRVLQHCRRVHIADARENARSDFDHMPSSETEAPTSSAVAISLEARSTAVHRVPRIRVTPCPAIPFGPAIGASDAIALPSSTAFDSGGTFVWLGWFLGDQRDVRLRIAALGFNGGEHTGWTGTDHHDVLRTRHHRSSKQLDTAEWAKVCTTGEVTP